MCVVMCVVQPGVLYIYRRMKRGRKKIATEEKRRIKRVVSEKDSKNSDDSTQSINRAQHDNAPLFQSLTCTTSDIT